MTDRIDLTLSFEVDEFNIVDGRKVARAAVRTALKALAPYAEGSPERLEYLFDLLSSEVVGDFCYRGMKSGLLEHQMLCFPDRSIDDLDAHIAKVRAELAPLRSSREGPIRD